MTVDGGGAPGAGTHTVAWFHCFAGVAGDMALGSLLDAGADLDAVRAVLDRLPLDGWSLAVEDVLRCGVGATRATFTVTDEATSRTYAEIAALVDKADLAPRIAARSHTVLAALATAEARLHRTSPDDVHLHEVGGHDALLDVVGTAAALEVLGVDRIECSPVAHGTGTVTAAHGVLPNPPPAVVELLRGVPAYGRDLDAELTTPTGAAIVGALAERYGPLPAMRITASGFGAGRRELDELPNCTQVVIGTATTADTRFEPGQPVLALEANLDDATGEQLAHAVERLIDEGAHDAWLTPVIMKKGRPGVTVHVLCDAADGPRLRRVLRDETGTIGTRGSLLERWPASRRTVEVDVDGHRIRVKVSGARVKAEHDDVVAAAAALGLPARQIAARAERDVPDQPGG